MRFLLRASSGEVAGAGLRFLVGVTARCWSPLGAAAGVDCFAGEAAGLPPLTRRCFCEFEVEGAPGWTGGAVLFPRPLMFTPSFSVPPAPELACSPVGTIGDAREKCCSSAFSCWVRERMVSTPPGPERLFPPLVFSLDCMSASRRGVDFGGELGSATVSVGASGAERDVTKDLKSSSNIEGQDASIKADVYLENEKGQTIFDRSLPSIILRGNRYLLIRSKFNNSLIFVAYPPSEFTVRA